MDRACTYGLDTILNCGRHMAKHLRTKRKNRGNRKKQNSQYDKIWRENMQGALPGIIKNVLGIDVLYSEDLPGKVQVTSQKELDVLRKVTDANGETFILHIEVQTRDDPDMAYRMLEYRVMAELVYRLPVRQYVIYLGETASTMPTGIRSWGLSFEYTIISIRDLNYRLFLASEHPQEKLLAILGDFGRDDPVEVIKKIVSEVRSVSCSSFSEYQYLQQLRIMIQLRNLALEFDKVMKTVADFFREERDPFFIAGERKTKTEVVRNLLRSGRFTISEISGFANVEKAFVMEIEAEMRRK